jgi:hypothetical protein
MHQLRNVLVQLATEIHDVSDLEYWPGSCTVPPMRDEIKTWETEYVHNGNKFTLVDYVLEQHSVVEVWQMSEPVGV